MFLRSNHKILYDKNNPRLYCVFPRDILLGQCFDLGNGC